MHHARLSIRRTFAAMLLTLGCRPSETPDAAASPTDAPDRAGPPASADEPSAPPEPEPIPGGGPDPLTLDAKASTSIGSPTEGRLDGSVPLPLHGKGYRFNPAKHPTRRHGTVELVQAVVRAAGEVERSLPGNQLTVGDLSMPQGGEIGGHASHRAGRDVDVMFYLLDERTNEPFPAKAIPIEPDGTGDDFRDLADPEDDVPVKLDVPRTWAFVQALSLDERADINRIFVAEHIRALLLAHAESIDAPPAAIERFGHLACQPNFPHDDHMHIRFFCSPDDIAAGCEDTLPLYPWHLAKLAELDLEPVLAGKRKKPRPKLTSVEQAQAKAEAAVPDMHRAVREFLERRKAWAKQPHPKRKYCR